MDQNVLLARREKLSTLLTNGEMLILFAAEEPRGINKFLQNNNFLYLTGLYETPEAVYVCYKHNNKLHNIVFIQRNNPEMIVWDGAKMYPEEAKEISGIYQVKFLDELETYIIPTLNISEKVYVNTGVQVLNKPPNKALYFVSQLRERFIHLVFADANKIMSPLRQIKDSAEIDYMCKAIEITGFGLEVIFNNAKAGMYEYELEAMLFYEMKRRGLDQYGFSPIIAAGVNATTLHYKKNNCKIQKNDLVLCDVGALYKNYSADITRTFPISGKFTKRQAAVYSEVLGVQQDIIKMIKPGISMKELNQKTEELIGLACVRLKLINDVKDFKKYYMHSIGHHLGMDTHDIGSRDSVLEEGMVITIEPGIYIAEEKIGVRIEDDILVTADSYKNLSAQIPKIVPGS